MDRSKLVVATSVDYWYLDIYKLKLSIINDDSIWKRFLWNGFIKYQLLLVSSSRVFLCDGGPATEFIRTGIRQKTAGVNVSDAAVSGVHVVFFPISCFLLPRVHGYFGL